MMIMSLGIIQGTNSTITIKHEDGEEIKLTILKNPIPLDTLKYENEGTSPKSLKEPKCRPRGFTNKNFVKGDPVKLENVTLLKEPISLDNIEWQDGSNDFKSSITYNVKTVQGFLCSKPRKNCHVENTSWKQNAFTIFENSFVYPFVHAGNKYKCFVCAKPFLDAVQLKDHTINEHSLEELKAELNNRVRDTNLKVDVTYLQCRICLQIVNNLQTLKTHLNEHGKEITDIKDNLIPYKLGGEKFDCQVCGEVFLKLRLLIIHMSKHFNNYACEICGAVFISLHLLKRHLQTHESGCFPCDKCDKIFNNAAKRTLHTRGVHLKQFPRRCPICPERFNSNYQRTKHLRIVHNQTTGLFRCDTCGRQYDLKYHLLIHVRSVHMQERNQECRICHSRFFSKYCLSRHMVKHTGEKSFKCSVCGKAFASKRNLKEHCRSHEVGLCNVCGLNCGDHESLVSHINAMHSVL